MHLVMSQFNNDSQWTLTSNNRVFIQVHFGRSIVNELWRPDDSSFGGSQKCINGWGRPKSSVECSCCQVQPGFVSLGSLPYWFSHHTKPLTGFGLEPLKVENCLNFLVSNKLYTLPWIFQFSSKAWKSKYLNGRVGCLSVREDYGYQNGWIFVKVPKFQTRRRVPKRSAIWFSENERGGSFSSQWPSLSLFKYNLCDLDFEEYEETSMLSTSK